MSQELKERLNRVESALAHLQNDYDALNEVILRQGHQIDTILKRIERLSEQLEETDAEVPPRDPIDEKPPHY